MNNSQEIIKWYIKQQELLINQIPYLSDWINLREVNRRLKEIDLILIKISNKCE